MVLSLLGGIGDAVSLLDKVIDAASGSTFPLAIEVENRTPYYLTPTPGFPFMPGASNTKEPQCGQTGQQSVLAVPKRIEAADKLDAMDVSAYDGHAVGLDGNVGSMSYTGYSNSSPLFCFAFAWFLGGGFPPSYAFFANSNGQAYDYEGSQWFNPGGYLAVTPSDTDGCKSPHRHKAPWRTSGDVLPPMTIKVGPVYHELIISATPGGNNDGYSLVFVINQQGYKPPDG